MSVDPISNVSRLIEALRQQITANKSSAAASATQNVRHAAGAAAQPGKKVDRSLEKKTLERKLYARIGKLQQQGGDFFEAATRMFVEDVLSWEFGEELKQDPRFQQMLDDIVSTVLKEDELGKQFRILFAKMKNN